MIRRHFLRGISFFGASSTVSSALGYHHKGVTDKEPFNGRDREYWINMLTRITSPLMEAMQADNIRQLMPVETHPKASRSDVAHLEALGRSLAGLAPWLELGPDKTEEGSLREKVIAQVVVAIRNAVTPSARSFMNFTQNSQPLVDAAFLAHGLLRAPRQIWDNLDKATQQHLAAALRSTRTIKPYYSNWLLFSAMIEAALWKFTGDYDVVRIDYALRSHEEWYKGDGLYGDGPDFHFDYYNSFVIQPMLLDVVQMMNEMKRADMHLQEKILTRAQRYAEIQERLISPEGSFPPVGRSLAYRSGAFQLLAQLALQNSLPSSLKPGQVRSALTAVLKRTLEPSGTFDRNGWLTIGLSGHQPGIGEYYISTGSLYLCTVAFLPLGLPAEDVFWTSQSMDWTSKTAFSGKDFSIDKALDQ